MSVHELRITSSTADLEPLYDSCMEKLNEFFALKWVTDTPQVYIVPDRRTIDILKHKRTEPWIIGWGEPNPSTDRVFLLARDALLTESNHVDNSIERYTELMMHELCHSFYLRLSGTHAPTWLNEGLCMYVSGQIRHRQRPERFTDLLEYFNHGGEGVYREAGFAIEALVNAHGKEKLTQVLHAMKVAGGHVTHESFDALFSVVYGTSPTYEMFDSLLEA